MDIKDTKNNYRKLSIIELDAKIAYFNYKLGN